MGREVIVFDDGRIIGPYDGDAAVLLDRYLKLVPTPYGRVCELVSPEAARITVEDVLRSV